MDNIENILKDDDTIVSSAKAFANDIIANKLDLTQFIEVLGPFLTSTDVDVRARTMRLLSTSLSNLPIDFLTSVQLNFISTFYCDRLKDHHSVIPNTLLGIETIVRMANLSDECATRLLQSMFQNVPCQSQVKEDRTKVFNIIADLSESKTQELQRMGPDFVYGFINAMDGERDPRILLSLFEFLPKFLQLFSLGHLNEEAFEVIACYFPIDFNPSPTDAGIITRDQLADKLSDCLCAHEAFAEDCINLSIEKLESQLNLAKLDALYLLSKAAQKFAPNAIDKEFPNIWKALTVELLPGTNKDIAMAALNTLQMILICVAKDETVLNNVLTVILATIMPSLSDVDGRLFMPSAAVALKCVATNKQSTKMVTLKCLPAFLLQINKDNAEQQVQRATLIELSGQLIAACIRNEVIHEIDDKLLETAQFEFINGLVNKTSGNEKLIKTALLALASTAEVVIDSNRVLVYRALNAYLLDANTANTTSIECSHVLGAFASRYPDEVSSEIVQNLLNIDYITEKLKPEAIAELFEVLCCLIPIRKFREEILQFLLKNIFNTEVGPKSKNEIRLIGVRVLHHILEDDRNEQLHEEMRTKYNILDRFIELIHSQQLNVTNADKLSVNDDILYEMSQIIRIIVKDLDASTQKALVEKYLPMINLQLKVDLYFAMGLLGYLEKSVDLENHFEQIVDELTKLSLSSDDADVTKISNELLSSLFNKCPDNEHHTNILKKIIKLIKTEVQKHNKKSIELLSWISKGLLARGHSQASELIETLIELLEHPSLGEAAVAAFEILSLAFPELDLPVFKHLFQQKLFEMCLKGIWHKLEASSEKHLSAFTFMMKLVPHQVLKNRIQKIGPVLLKSLDVNGVKSLLTALNICNRFVSEQDEYFRDHLQNLIPKCLKLSTNPDLMNIRIAAINILSNITKYPTFIILPFAQDVLFGLQAALDDKKRLVRDAAVLARNQWFLIGTET